MLFFLWLVSFSTAMSASLLRSIMTCYDVGCISRFGSFTWDSLLQQRTPAANKTNKFHRCIKKAVGIRVHRTLNQDEGAHHMFDSILPPPSLHIWNQPPEVVVFQPLSWKTQISIYTMRKVVDIAIKTAMVAVRQTAPQKPQFVLATLPNIYLIVIII